MRHAFLARLLVVCSLGFALCLPAIARPATQTKDFEKTLVGTIGTLPVHMTLKRDGNNLTGRYRYETAKPALRPAFSALELEGTVDAKGTFTLTETDYSPDKEVKSGLFTGMLTGGDVVRIEGAWSKSNGSKPLPFLLSEIRPTAGTSAITTATWSDPDKKLAKFIHVSYPQIEGARGEGFNAEMKKVVSRLVGDFKEGMADIDLKEVENVEFELRPEVTASTDDLVSVIFHLYAFSGGAHPNADRIGFTYDLKAGKPLTLDALFKPGSDYQKVLVEKGSQTFKGQDIFSAEEMSTDEPFGNWYLSPYGLTIVLSTAHVTGDYFEVFLPYAELQPILNPTGPAAAFLKN